MKNQKLEIRNQNKKVGVLLSLLFSNLCFLFCPSVDAQQPSTTTAPVFNANAKYVQGMGPGYWPTPGSQLTLNIAAGSATCGAPPVLVNYAGGTLAMIANATNYVYLDPSQNCAPASNTTGFAPGQIPLAKVVTNASTITSVTDARSFFTPQPLGTDTSGKAVAKYLNNFRFADQFPGSTGTAKLDAAIADFGNNPGVVIAPPGVGTGNPTAYSNSVPILDLRQTNDVFAEITSDPDRPAAILLEHQLGDFTTRPYSGTVTLTQGSTAVTGVNTHFLTEIGPGSPAHLGRSIKLDADASNAWAQVGSVTDDTHATLMAGYPGTGGTGPASYFITEFPFMIHNALNAGTPNTVSGGESVGLTVISERRGGSRGLYGGNFNSTYYTPASPSQGQAMALEVDLGNYSGVNDATNVPTNALSIISAGPNRPNRGIAIESTRPEGAFQRGISVTNWGEVGLFLSGQQDHLRFYTGTAPNANAQIGGRNTDNTSYIWRINNDGSGSFPSNVNFNGGLGSTGVLSLSSGANGNITLSPNGSGVVVIPGTSGDGRMYLQTGPPASAFDPIFQSFPPGATNNMGCLNAPVNKGVCFLALAQNNTPNSTFTGSYGVVVSTAASGTHPVVNAVEGDAYSEGGANISKLAGVSGYAQQSGIGTVTHLAALNAVTNLKENGTVTNNYGLYVEDESGIGINNYGVYTVGPAPSSFGGAVISGLNTVAFSSTPTFDASRGNTQKVILTGNVSSSTLANAAAGEQINFVICQDGTGGRTFVWPANVAQAPPVNPNLNACTYYSTVFDGSSANPLTPPQALPNITPATVAAATSADQNLMSIPVPAGMLNSLGKTITVFGAGTYTTGTSGMGTMTFKVKLCAVAGCGSGTVVTLGTFGPTGTQVASSTNIPWNVSMTVATSTVGASGKVIPHGALQTVLSATPSAAGVVHLTQTTGQSATIDLTVPTYLQFTIADSGASANNSFTQIAGLMHGMN